MNSLYVNGTKMIDDPELVLFDKDGTIIDIHHYWTSMIGIRADFISDRWFSKIKQQDNIKERLKSAMGVDIKTGRIKQDGPVGIKPRPYIVNVATNVVADAGISIGNDAMEKLFSDVDMYTSSNMKPLLKLLPGVLNLLKSLQCCGVNAAVVSTDITSRALKAMQELGIDKYFCSVKGGDSVCNTKPAADLANLVVKEGRFSTEKTAVIGDHPVDIQMGINAGITTNIGVLTGLSSDAAFENMKCEIVTNLKSVHIRC